MIHIAVVIKKKKKNHLSGCSLVVLLLRSSSRQTALGFLANIGYYFGAIVEDVAQCCGLVVQGYNITFDGSFLNRLLEDGW